MTVYAIPGSTFEASVSKATTGQTGTIGVRISNLVTDTDFLARTTAGITEYPAGSGIYARSCIAPTTVGTYSIIWDLAGVYAAEDLVITYTLPATVATTPYLCTLADVREELEMSVTETGRDTKITDLLPIATKVILKWTGREFVNYAPGADATPRKFSYYGGTRLNLAPYDLQSASVVQMDTDTSPITLAATTDYYLEPLPAPEGVYTHLLFTSLEPADIGGRDTRREVSITGVWGFAAVPVDVKRAAVLTIAGWLDKAVNEYGNSADGDARQFVPGVGSGYQLSLGVKAILSDYRRRGVA